jgi:hypothetical protein
MFQWQTTHASLRGRFRRYQNTFQEKQIECPASSFAVSLLNPSECQEAMLLHFGSWRVEPRKDSEANQGLLEITSPHPEPSPGALSYESRREHSLEAMPVTRNRSQLPTSNETTLNIPKKEVDATPTGGWISSSAASSTSQIRAIASPRSY